MTTELIEETEINNVYANIKELVINSRNKVYTTVNIEMLNLYWNIGKTIMDIQKVINEQLMEMPFQIKYLKN